LTTPLLRRAARSALHRLIAGVMSPHLARARIDRPIARREDVLPRPLARRVRVLAGERERQVHRAEARREVLGVQLAHAHEMAAQRGSDARGEHRHPVARALAVAHDDLAPREVDVLHAQAQRLHDAQAGAVEQAQDQAGRARSAREHRAHLLARQHDGQPRRPLGGLDPVEPRQLDLEHLLVEEEQGALRLVLGRGRHPPRHGKMGEEGFDLDLAQRARMALAVKEYEPAHPIRVGPLGADAIVLEPDSVAQLVQQPGLRSVHGSTLQDG